MKSDRDAVVFDTSTIIGALLFPHSPPAQAFYHAATNYRVVASEETLVELQAVSRRDKFDRWRSPAEREQFLNLYLGVVEIVPVERPIEACRDPKDNSSYPSPVPPKRLG